MNKPTSRAACGVAVTVVLVAVATVSWVGRTARADEPKPGDTAKPADASKPRNYSGKYLAEGSTGGDRKYRAMVEITREGDVYQVVWVLGPRESYMGVGITEGNALCVGWSNGQVPGLVVYRPDNDKLVGRWTAPGSRGKVFTETLTPVK
jgi:hypothetical protein